LAILLLLGSVAIIGREFAAGAATGALATGAGYEYNSKRQMDRLEDDYRNERISRSGYERRKEQIERGSIIYRAGRCFSCECSNCAKDAGALVL
jgi:hypothetical protein